MMAVAARRFVAYRRSEIVGLSLFGALNLGVAWAIVQPDPTNGDWQLWTAVAGVLQTNATSIYAVDVGGLRFVWSVPAAYLMSAVVTVGYWPWLVSHYAALALLWRTPMIAAIAALSWPLWTDAMEGNTFTFVCVAGILAVRGSRPAGLAYLALTVLIPRPVCVPLAAWLLWRQPSFRIPTAVLAVLVFALSWSELVAWATAVGAYEPPFNMSPTRFIGEWWFLIGVPLATWLAWRGWLGAAGMAISPYVMPYYWLVLLIDFARSRAGAGNLLSPAPSPSRHAGHNLLPNR